MDERLEAVLNAGIEETILPSGMHVRGVRPDVEELIKRQLLPADLRRVFVEAANEEADQEDDERQARIAAAGLGFLDYSAAAFIQEYRFDARAAWRPLEVTVEQFRRMSLADRRHLHAFMKRSEEIADLATFRDVAERPAGGEDGADVARDPVEPAANPRRRRGVRAR